MVRVKICGITSIGDAECAVGAGADAIGLNFYRGSPRCVAPATARAIAERLPAAICRVGVFANMERSEIEAIVETAGLSAVQLHGEEPPELCAGWRVPVIKAFRVRARRDIERISEYCVDFVLLDAYQEDALGGTGVRFDWSLLDSVDRRRLILAGGLTPENVSEAVRRIRPFAVDVASGVERAPGIKDPEKVRRFVANAKTA